MLTRIGDVWLVVTCDSVSASSVWPAVLALLRPCSWPTSTLCRYTFILFFLWEISRTIALAPLAVLPLDRTRWHITLVLVVPDNVTLLFLLRQSLELNPVEDLWRFLCQSYRSNRAFRPRRPSPKSAARLGTHLRISPGASCLSV